MGSPEDEPDRRASSESPLHRRRIGRTFAVGTREVTVKQFRRFVADVSGGNRTWTYAEHYSPDPDGPAVGITWYDAAEYCNWLSKQEGIPESEWCYPAGGLGDKTKLPDDFLRRKGYRLPTEAEWEYACRAGAVTARFYGTSPALLDEFAWYYRNSDDRGWPGGLLRPNDLGLFDVYGNALEWCQDRLRAYPSASLSTPADDEPGPFDLTVVDNSLFARVMRGGSFGSRPSNLRSAARLRDRPGTRFDSVGFRIARTLD
jgi:formylglycine-generating enzyme required for sulfatase activity